MVKVLVLLTKKDGMSRDGFRRHWREVHAPIAQRLPGLRRYVQNHAVSDGAPYDGIAELWFDSAEAMQAAFTSEPAQESARDAANFLAGQQLVIAEEVELSPQA